MGRLSIALLLALLANATSRTFAQPRPTLDQRASLSLLVDTWVDSAGGRWVITPVGKTGGIRSAYRAVDGAYEAHALWWYDSTSRLIRAFELNSLGQVLRHEGRFVSRDTLVLDRLEAGRVVQHSVLSWRGPQLAFDAETRGADGTRSAERIVFLRAASTPAVQGARPADVDAVGRLSAEIDRCLREKDLAAFAALWTEDIVLLNPDQPPIVGRSAVKESYRTFLDAFDYVGRHQPLETHTVGDLVIHRGVARGTLTPTGGGNALPINMKYLWLLRRQPDGSLREWRVMINAEPAATSPDAPR